MNEPCIHLKIKGKKNQNLKRLEKDSQGQKLKLKKKNKTYSRVYKQRGKYTRFF